MSGPSPSAQERIVRAHEYFSQRARAWLTADSEVRTADRASVLVDTVSTRFQLVVIDLKSDEDAQEIFDVMVIIPR